MKRCKDYILYKGETPLIVGTSDDLASYLNCQRKSVLFLASPTYKKRIKEDSNRVVVYAIEENEGE